MRYVKMLGLAAVAAAAVMAFVGASAASATVLCSEAGTGTSTGTTCPASRAYPAGTVIHAVNEGHVTITDGSGNLLETCKESTIEGKTNNEGSATETVKGPVEKLTWAGCVNSSGQVCEIKTLKGGTFEVHWIENTHNGTFTYAGAEITTLCPSIFGNIHCIYVTNNTDLGTLTGGNPATLDVETAAVPQLATSGLCSAEAKWDAKYEVTSPKPLYVAGHT